MNVYAEIAKFYAAFGGKKSVIGRSVEGRAIYALHIGSEGGPQLLAQYAIHGREWITGLLALTHVRRGLARGGAWIVPLSNPDGALLSETGIESVSKSRRQKLIQINKKEDFSLWKANAEAVDLNVNFSARWGTGKRNVRAPASENYIGPAPFSEPETRALRDFTRAVMPALTVSFHTKGEVIYWQFFQPAADRVRDRRLAGVLSVATGYPLGDEGQSAGGYKDWCIAELRIPAFTVEVGADHLAHPIGREALPALIDRLEDALYALSAESV